MFLVWGMNGPQLNHKEEVSAQQLGGGENAGEESHYPLTSGSKSYNRKTTTEGEGTQWLME